ncbi:MAG: hypothetical protein GY804_08640 [Alphaproteobacteria bacterium]|nr:hypothetical protein [Alphaproteobacteria bacterium]
MNALTYVDIQHELIQLDRAIGTLKTFIIHIDSGNISRRSFEYMKKIGLNDIIDAGVLQTIDDKFDEINYIPQIKNDVIRTLIEIIAAIWSRIQKMITYIIDQTKIFKSRVKNVIKGIETTSDRLKHLSSSDRLTYDTALKTTMTEYISYKDMEAYIRQIKTLSDVKLPEPKEMLSPLISDSPMVKIMNMYLKPFDTKIDFQFNIGPIRKTSRIDSMVSKGYSLDKIVTIFESSHKGLKDSDIMGFMNKVKMLKSDCKKITDRLPEKEQATAVKNVSIWINTLSKFNTIVLDIEKYILQFSLYLMTLKVT